MDPAALKKLIETPISITLNAHQFGLLIKWLEIETLGRTVEMDPMEPGSEAYAQAAQQLQDLDEILATISAAYKQEAEKLNIATMRTGEGD
jgi:hypothetical protein